MKIGYQGGYGSNSEEATLIYLNRHNVKCDLKEDVIPLVNSSVCVEKLEKKEVDYIVVAVKNTLGGVVEETKLALKDKDFEFVDEVVLPIHHCVFKKPGSDINSIRNIISHQQALLQTKEYRSKFFPNCGEVAAKCTAESAKNLDAGIYDDTNLVICRKNAGEMYNLELVAENIEDSKDNETTFYVYKRK